MTPTFSAAPITILRPMAGNAALVWLLCCKYFNSIGVFSQYFMHVYVYVFNVYLMHLLAPHERLLLCGETGGSLIGVSR